MTTILKNACPYCKSDMILKETSKFKYKNGQNKKFYSCINFPNCNGSHGASPEGEPLGVPATKEVKDWRIKAHNAFDKLWKNGKMTKNEAYSWISNKMAKKKIHIGELDKIDCEKIIQIVEGRHIL
jgi:ssDNA-binding Zn-finger/Zn-ribbon topoisomerase 1